MNKSLQISGLVAAMMLGVGGAEAAGLGKLSIQSALGQPLRAEIELLSVTPEELGTVDARLANAEAFRQAHIARSETHGNLRFAIEQRANGAPYLKVTSATPVNDPFLDLLIELNWSTGRILREYTLLLDPPAETRPKAAAPRVAGAAPEQAAAKPQAPKASASPREAAQEAAAPQKYGPVQSGETLHSIARKLLHKDVTLEMMVASLYQANKQAFGNNNMNLLKKGQVLKVPGRDAVMLMFSPHQAGQLIREHSASWQAYRGELADTAAKAPAEASAPSPMAGKVLPAKPQEAVAPPAASKDVLKLSKGEPPKAQQDTQALQRIQSLEEELAAKSRALQEAQDRVAQLERTIGDLQKLANLKTQAPAAAGEAPAAAAPSPAPAAAQATPQPPKPKAAAVPAPVLPPQEESSWLGGLLENPLYLGGLGAAALLSGLLGYMVVSSRRRKAMASFEQSIMSGGDQFKTAIFRTGAGKTVGAAATQGPMTELSRLGLGAIDTHEVDPIAEAEVYMAYGRDAQAEEILKAAMAKDPNRHEIQVKLLEIYAGRQDKAAFETQAGELYAALGGQSTAAWRKVAEMGRSLDANNPLYQVAGAAAASLAEVKAAGQEAEPDLGAEAELPDLATQPSPHAAAASTEDAGGIIEFDLPEAASAEPKDAVLEMPPQASATADESPLDFEPLEADLELPEVAPADAEPVKRGITSPDEMSLMDALEEIELEAPEAMSASDEASAESLQDLVSAEFGVPAAETAAELAEPGLDAGLPEHGRVPQAPARDDAVLPNLDFSSIDLDLKDVPDATLQSVPVDSSMSQIDSELWEEVNTKLDLAKAYLEMGDKEGAREILQEILNEGDDQQQAEARGLLTDTE